MWSENPVGGYYNTCWLTGLWSAQANVESIVLMAALRWGSNSNSNSPTPPFVGLLSTWGSMDSDHMFSPHFVAELLKWTL